MERRHFPGRSRVVGCLIAFVLGGVIAVGSPEVAGAALSADDCELLLDAGPDVDRGSSDNVDNFADQADALEATAGEISNKKLRKALLRISAVYAAAGKARNDRAAAVVIASRSRDYAKGFKVFGKSLNQCLTAGTR